MNARLGLPLCITGLLTVVVAAPAVIGCGAAPPGAASPEAVVAVAPVTPPVPAKTATPDTDPPPAQPRILTARSQDGGIDVEGEFVDAFSAPPTAGVVGGVIGGVPGGVIGGLSGSSAGVGGLGLSGVGVGGGGAGFGVGGFGSTGGRYAISGPGYVPGASIYADDKIVIEYGDSATSGVSVDFANQTLRGQVHKLRACYREALEKTPRLSGTITLRLVFKKDGYIAYSSLTSTTLSNPAAEKCLRDAFLEVYVTLPPSGQPGVIETALTFRPAK